MFQKAIQRRRRKQASIALEEIVNVLNRIHQLLREGTPPVLCQALFKTHAARRLLDSDNGRERVGNRNTGDGQSASHELKAGRAGAQRTREFKLHTSWAGWCWHDRKSTHCP